jgi:hypothetical protein
VLIRLWIDWVYMCLVRFLGHKICKTCSDLNTSSVGNMLSFPTPTRTHVFNNHSNGDAVYDEDINTLATIIPSVEILAPITRS